MVKSTASHSAKVYTMEHEAYVTLSVKTQLKSYFGDLLFSI